MSNILKTTEVTANRKHKANLFVMIFSDPKEALQLYNAVNGTSYRDTSMLRFNAIENVLYMGMENDVSFLMADDMNLYEGQSTRNPNMPLRGLFYFSRLYQAYVETQGLNIYANTLLKLPMPRYIVFYNGTEIEPERRELRLSDSFTPRPGERDEPALECVAQVLNINFGHNQEIMRQCRKLYEYSYLINAIRKHLVEGFKLDTAMNLAVDECINKDILKEFLVKHRAEVRNVILEEYDAEFHINWEKRASYNDGFQERLVRQVCRKLQKRKSPKEIAEELEEELKTIRIICRAAENCGPDYDWKRVCEKLRDRRELLGV